MSEDLDLSRIYVLFDFEDKMPGVGTVSSIFKPHVPIQNPVDAINLLKSWISSQKMLTVMWTGTKDDLFNIDVGFLGSQKTSSMFRPGRAISISDDKDELKEEAKRIVKQRSKSQVVPSCRRQLLPGPSKSSSEEPKGDASSALLETDNDGLETGQPQNKRPLSLEEINIELRAKIQKLENENSSFQSKIKDLESDALKREEELGKLSILLGEKEDEVMDLKEKLEENQPIVLTTKLQENINTLGSLIEQFKSCSPTNSFVTPPRTLSAVRSSQKMVTLHGDIVIEDSALVAAIAAARSGGDTDRSLNKFVGLIMEAFWTPAELANMCRTGRACQSIPGSKQKEKFPDNYLTAIQKYTVAKWAKLFPGAKVNCEDVNGAVKAKLLNCHSAQKRKVKGGTRNTQSPSNTSTPKSSDAVSISGQSEPSNPASENEGIPKDTDNNSFDGNEDSF